jgi:hypothetical protein
LLVSSIRYLANRLARGIAGRIACFCYSSAATPRVCPTARLSDRPPDRRPDRSLDRTGPRRPPSLDRSPNPSILLRVNTLLAAPVSESLISCVRCRVVCLTARRTAPRIAPFCCSPAAPLARSLISVAHQLGCLPDHLYPSCRQTSCPLRRSPIARFFCAPVASLVGSLVLLAPR